MTYKLFKTVSGSTIISIVRGESSTHYFLENPYEIIGASFIKWMPMSDSNQVSLTKSHIISKSSPAPNFIQLYEEIVQQQMAMEDFFLNASDEEIIKFQESRGVDNFENSKQVPSEENPNIVGVNFDLPIDLFMSFLSSGIMSIDKEENEIDFDSEKFMSVYKDMKKQGKESKTQNTKKEPKQTPRNSSRILDGWDPIV